MQIRTETRLAKGAPGDESFALGRYIKGLVSFYWVGVVVFGGIFAAAIRRQAVAGNLTPVNFSNLNLVGLAVFVLSLLALMLGYGYGFFLLAKTTISSWGFTRQTWLGGLAVPWSEIVLVTSFPRGLKFKTKNGKTLVIPFRAFDSVPKKLLDLLSERIPRAALAGLDPDAPASWWSEKSR